MSRVLKRAVRLLKIGAVAGVAVGVGRVVMRRRRKPASGESAWPTIAETAAQNGQAVDEAVDSPEEFASNSSDGPADAEAGVGTTGA